MLRKDLIEMVEGYQKKYGFNPGCLAIGEESVDEVLELLKEALPESRYEIYKDLIKKDINNVEKIPVMGMGILLVKDGGKLVELRRHTGRVTTIKPQGMHEAYMPMADITNSMRSIMKASLAFFPDVTDDADADFVEFARKMAEFIMKDTSGSWEDEDLPELQSICTAFVEKSPNAPAFFLRFFMCVVDFYKHCTRIKPGSDAAVNRESFDKALDMSAFIRTIPKEMRSEYLDHLASHGMLSDILGRKQ